MKTETRTISFEKITVTATQVSGGLWVAANDFGEPKVSIRAYRTAKEAVDAEFRELAMMF